jgi:DNA-directed RNA polymerase sigma subunit (sigma70/sigma32)
MITDITRTLWILEESIRTVKGTLSDRDYSILNERFGLDGKSSKTLRVIAKKHKLSTSRVGQIISQSIRRAKRAIRVNRTKRIFQEAMYAIPR